MEYLFVTDFYGNMQIEQSLALHVENPEQSVQWFCKYISIIETFWTTFTQNVIFRINKKNCMITSFHHYYFVIINYHYYSENILYRAIKSHWPAKLIGPWNSNRDTFFLFFVPCDDLSIILSCILLNTFLPFTIRYWTV